MPKYEVEIIERDMIVRRALVVIEAADEADANLQAQDIEVANWEEVGRDTERAIESLARLDDGCEFCRQEFNRPAGGFDCPYCAKVWPGACP